MRRPYRPAGHHVAASAGELDAGDRLTIQPRLDTKSVADQLCRHDRGVEKVSLHVDGVTEKRGEVVDVAGRKSGTVHMKGHQQHAVWTEDASELVECLNALCRIEVNDRVHRHQA